jgi:hypothetical protein
VGVIPNQLEIVKRLSELSRLLDAATDEVAVLDEDAVRAKQANEVAYARAFLAADGPMDARKAQAVIVTADAALAMELAQAKHRACRERIRTLGVQIEVGRTLSAATRSQFAAEAVGQHT